MVGTGKHVLEVGCAGGYMSRQLAARGNRVTGIDVDAEALEEARIHCEEAFLADLDTQPLADLLQGEQYDVVVFGDVLEHLRDPLKVLRDARSFLSVGGFVVISIPNIAHGSIRLSLLRGAFDYAPLGLLDETHLRFFTLRSVRELCLRAGYDIEAIERTKVPLFLETEVVPKIAERNYSRDLIDEIRRDPEHDTLQFVIRAVPAWNFERLGLSPEVVADVEMRLAEAAVKIDRLEHQLQEFNGTAERLTEVEVLLADRNGEVARGAALVEDLRQQLAAAQKESGDASDARLEVERVRGQYQMMVEAYKRHIETDIALVRVESAQVDGMIRAIQNSFAWSLKTLLLRARRRLPGARARV